MQQSHTQRPSQFNAYGMSVTAAGRTSGALMSRQQQSSMQAADASGMLMDALEKYGPAPGARVMLDGERAAAEQATNSGIYVSWRSMPTSHDCTRVGDASLCFCGHPYSLHNSLTWKRNRVPCTVSGCACRHFAFMPGRPEEVGEWWLVRRKDFDVSKWRGKCKCSHTHVQHHPGPSQGRRCNTCGCSAFHSAFLCVVCDKHWEEHETIWETRMERIQQSRPVDEDYQPFAEVPQIRQLVFDRKQEVLKARPGERKKTGTSKTGTATRAALPSSAASKPNSSSSAARTSSVRHPSSSTRSPATSSSSFRASSSRSASSSAVQQIEQQIASHSLEDKRADIGRGDLSSGAVPQSTATASAVPPQRRPARTGRQATSSSIAPSRASAAREARRAMETELMAQAKKSSSGFNAVFD